MKYKIGDKVKVRQWDDMAAEFGLDDEDIDMKYYFLQEMKDFCGRVVTIQSVAGDIYGIIEDVGNNYCWTDDMFEDEFTDPILIGADIYNLVKGLSDKLLVVSSNMTDGEKSAYNFGKEQTLSLLNQFLNELFLEEDNVITPTYIVHVPGLNTATDFASIDEIQEQFGGKDL